MSFPSIFSVNGCPASVRVNPGQNASTFSDSYCARVGLTTGQVVVVTAPIGENAYSVSVDVRLAAAQFDDVILGSRGKRPLLFSELFINEITRMIVSSNTNIVNCDLAQLKRYLSEHGLSIGFSSISNARNRLIFHVMYGMCSSHDGAICSHLASGMTQLTLIQSIMDLMVDFCRQSLLSIPELRFICNAMGHLQLKHGPMDDLLQVLTTPLLISTENNDRLFDLVTFLQSVDKATSPVLYKWCSLHGIYPSGPSRDVKRLLMEHVINAQCMMSSSNVYDGCFQARLQSIKTFPDADQAAFILSLACLIDNVPRPTLELIMSIVCPETVSGFQLSLLRQKLRQHVFSLRRGRGVYHGVLRDLRTHKHITKLNRHRSQWPCVADQMLKDKIRSLFENEIRDQCSVHAVCASCSVKYYTGGFTTVTTSEVDLDLLQLPCVPERVDGGPYSDVDLEGPLANLLIDKRGLIRHEHTTDLQIMLCMPCYRALKHSHIPKYALINNIYVGEVPAELRNLTPVEENMIALCRAKCLTVQLRSIRGTGESQRGFRGHTIFHQQDVGTLATLLPPSIEEILAPICVLFVGSERPSPQWIRDHAKPLIVRANVVRRALKWLIANNPLYASVQINNTVLDKLERDGGLTYPVEYIDESHTSSTPVSSHTPASVPPLAADPPQTEQVSTDHDIPFENVMLTDIDPSATPRELRAAALRHLKSGKPYLLYGHAAAPETEYHNPNLFPSLYPTLFPFGVGGFEDPSRYPRISLIAHARHLLNIADNRFRRHPSFIFSVFNILQRREVAQRTTMRVCRASFDNKARVYARLQPDTIQRVADQMESGSFTFDNHDERNVCDLMRDVHMVNSTVAGSAAARLKMRNEIRAMITSFGAPSFFITINPADVYSPVVKLLAGEDIDLNNLLPDHIPDYHEQSILIAKDPVLAARFFHIYMKAFFTAVLGIQSGNTDMLPVGLFGLTKGYYGVVEAQGRGSLHCHMVLWLEGSLNQNEIYDRVLTDQTGDFERRMIAYLDDNIRTEVMPDPGDIANVPSSNYNPSSVRPVCQAHDESDPAFAARRAKDMYNLSMHCQRHKHNEGCYKYWSGPPETKTCRFDLDSEKKVESTHIDKQTGVITTRCLDGMVNPFNETILEILRCNMDIKFIGSGNSAHAVLYYITNYISKMQLKTHVAYNVLAAALERLKTYNNVEDYDDTHFAKKVLMKSANAIISTQELSAQQVSASLLGNGERYTSHSFKELYWRSFVDYVDHVLPGNSMEMSNPSAIMTTPPAAPGADDDSRDNGNVPTDNDSQPDSDEDDPAYTILGSNSLETSDRHDTSSTLLSDPIVVGSGPYVTVKVDASGNLIPKAGHVADYVYRPAAMDDMSLWAFLSFTDKRLTSSRSTPSSANDSNMDVDHDQLLEPTESNSDYADMDEQEVPPFDEHSTDTSGVTDMSFMERIYQDRVCPSRLLPFSPVHPDAKTHSLYVAHIHNKYILVPSGPAIPRFDRDSTKPAFCQLMLVLFKPWREPRNLMLNCQTWPEAFNLFVESDDTDFDSLQIMKNIQFMHECRDSRDRDAASKRLRRVPVQDADVVSPESDLSSTPVDDEHSLLQDRHDLLLRDAHRQFDATLLRSNDYSDAIAMAGLLDCNPGAISIPLNITDPDSLLDFTALRREWKAHYLKRRKAVKESLQSISSIPTFSDSSSFPTSSLTEFRFDDLDFTPSTSSNPSSAGVGLDILPLSSLPTSRSLCQAICDRWTLNADQKRAFTIIADHASGCSTSNSPLTLLITGPAGSGKTQVINALRHFFFQRDEARRLRVTSYMGIAACNVSGITLHSALNLNPSQLGERASKKKSSDDLKYMWTGVDYLFIDEVSMISCEFLQTINTTLCRATGRLVPFGGLSVIFAGDMAQLPPVGETRLSAHVDPSRNSSSDRLQNKIKGKLLWLSVQNVVMLQKINRQSGAANVRFVELLTRLRDGRCNASDYSLLQSRIVSPLCNIQHWNLNPGSFVPVIVTDNTAKDRINRDVAAAFARKSNQMLRCFRALDEKEGSLITDPSLCQIIALLHSGRTSGRLNSLPLVIGMPVMITTNIDLMGGIVNGSLATVRVLDYTTLPNGDHILNHCIVHIPTAIAPSMAGLGPNEYPILPDTVPVFYQGPLSKRTLSFKRTQVPVIPAFAMTAHKSQGQTLDKAIVDLTSCRGTESPYVMISRVRSLNDLLILRPFPLAKVRCRQSEDTRLEQQRLKRLHLSTIVTHGSMEEQQQATSELNNFVQRDISHMPPATAVPVPSLDPSPPRKRPRLN